MNKDNFQWTDELVSEFIGRDSIHSGNVYADIHRFKQSKQQYNKDWEIVSIKGQETNTVYTKKENNTWVNSNNNGFIHDYNKDDGSSGCYIYSVRRLSDNEVFTVGEEVEFCGNDNFTSSVYIGVIKSINKAVSENELCFIIEDIDGELNSKFIRNIRHRKTPLFKTEDGKDIYEGDEYWFVPDSLKDAYINTASKTNFAGKSGHKYFSTAELALEYILLNKPCFSISDVMLECEKGSFHTRPHDRFDEDYWAIYNSVLKEKLQQLAQQKINNTK